jgi:tRNA G46 methylase TrmB
MVDRATWTPPEAPARTHRKRVPGAMGGSLLLDQPAHTVQKSRIDAFVNETGPLAVEVGFDHGVTLLSQARAWPGWRWLGVEIRRRRVAALQPHVPDNCLAERLDARTLFASDLLLGRVDRVDVLFPTPPLDGRHMLWTPGFVADVARALRPDGVVQVATDVPALARLVEDLLQAWSPAPLRPRAAEPSRRERVCRRDDIAVWWRAFSPPVSD